MSFGGYISDSENSIYINLCSLQKRGCDKLVLMASLLLTAVLIDDRVREYWEGPTKTTRMVI